MASAGSLVPAAGAVRAARAADPLDLVLIVTIPLIILL
jgi:hypothetical protein